MGGGISDMGGLYLDPDYLQDFEDETNAPPKKKAEILTHSDAEDGKVDKKYFISCPDESVVIPHPTTDDIRWAETAKQALDINISNDRWATENAIKQQHFSKLMGEAIKNGHHWRLQYLMSGGICSEVIENPRSYHFFSAAENQDEKMIRLIIANKGDIVRAIKFFAGHKENKYLIEFANEKHPIWTPQSGQKIMRTEFTVDEQATLQTHRSVFNFSAKRISRTTQIDESYINGSEERFSDQDTDTEIAAAYNALAAHRDDLPPLEEFTSKAFVSDTPKSRIGPVKKGIAP